MTRYTASIKTNDASLINQNRSRYFYPNRIYVVESAIGTLKKNSFIKKINCYYFLCSCNPKDHHYK